MIKMVKEWLTLTLHQWMMKNKKHPIINKLKYALRHDKLWHTKVITNKKKEQKKRVAVFSLDTLE